MLSISPGGQWLPLLDSPSRPSEWTLVLRWGLLIKGGCSEGGGFDVSKATELSVVLITLSVSDPKARLLARDQKNLKSVFFGGHDPKNLNLKFSGKQNNLGI